MRKIINFFRTLFGFRELEVWKIIPGWDKKYLVSSHGRIKILPHYVNIKHKNGTKQKRFIKGYTTKGLRDTGRRPSPTVMLRLTNHKKECSVSRLVAEAFIENPNTCRYVRPLDKNHANNYYKNLHWTNEKRARVKAIKHGNGRGVVQLTKEKKLIKTHNSIRKAAEKVSCSDSSIGRACRNKIPFAGGYIWMYKEDYEYYVYHNKDENQN